MHRGLLLQGRNAHQPIDGKPESLAAERDESLRLAGNDAGLLRLFAGIDLHEEAQAPAGARHLFGERAREFRPVDGLDDVEQRDGVAHLVRLQRTDQMQLDIGIALFQRRPLADRFLDPVLAEAALPQRDRLGDDGSGDRFRHRHELDRVWLAVRRLGSKRDLLPDQSEPLRHVHLGGLIGFHVSYLARLPAERNLTALTIFVHSACTQAKRARTMAAERYDALKREKHWQAAWAERGIFRAFEDDPRPKYYVLEMFPYPSGRIHMGHVRNYTMGDVIARYMRAKGHNVLHPMGWDGFGLPAENAAIERGGHPAKSTYDNIAVMRDQLKGLGLSIDWTREFATCNLAYYHQQQRLFLDLLKAGLVDRKTRKVNWDPVDQTVLANEQVIDGRGWRSGAPVEQREQPEWVFKITDYAEDLLQALDRLEHWPEKVRLMQANWIGRSEGLLVRFAIEGGAVPKDHDLIEVFTTRPDTLFGASFLAIAPDHPLAKAIAEQNPDAAAFIAECHHHGTSAAALETQEKKGLDTGLRVLHPLIEGAELPVFIANFIVMEYGTGAIFGVPAHDQRDLEFARAKGLPVIQVVLPPGADPKRFTIGEEAYTGDGTMINSGFLDGLTVAAAKDAVADHLAKTKLKGRPVGERQTQYRLRDWGISRQRYWGCPIPMIHCSSCGIVPVPESDLPVKLPDDVSFDRPGNPLDRHPTWKHVTCPRCGGAATRETDTMDTFVRLVLVFRALLLAEIGRANRPRGDRLLAPGRSVYRRSGARDSSSPLRAVLHPRHA